MKFQHICFVNSLRDLGGAELWFLDAASGLRDRGLKVSIVAQPGSQLLDRARQAGLATAAIPIRCDGAPWTLAALWCYFRHTRVTALICNLTKDLKAAGLAGRWAGVPIRLASRESDFPLKSKGYYRWYFRQAATGVLVNSEATKMTVLNSAPWLPSKRVHLLYKGIDLNRFQTTAPDAAARPPVVGFVGQLIERKGLDALMAAWSLIDDTGWATRPRLRLAGEGPLRPAIEQWRSSLHYPEAVSLEGFVEDIAGFWAGCRCAVLPSRAEGFGLAAAEASACGLPVVATRASSLPEVVLDLETGLLVPPDDPAALSDALDQLLRDDILTSKLAARARGHVAESFDRDHCLDRLIQLTCPEDPS